MEEHEFMFGGLRGKLVEVAGAGSSAHYHLMEWRDGKTGIGWYYTGSLRMTEYGWRADGTFERWMDELVELINKIE